MFNLDSIEKTVNELRGRWINRKALLRKVNKNIDFLGKYDIIRMDVRDRSHKKNDPKSRAKDVQFREVDDKTIAIKNGKAVGGNPYTITAMNGGDPNNPDDVKKTKEELSHKKRSRPEPEVASDLLASPSKPGDAPLKCSRYGENEYCTGFASKDELEKHIKDHLVERDEFGDIEPKEYVTRGIKFLAGECTGEDIDGDNTVGYMYSDKNGNEVICRYNPKTGEYAKGIPGWRLITYFKPKWENGYNRFNRKASEEYYLERRDIDLKGNKR